MTQPTQLTARQLRRREYDADPDNTERKRAYAREWHAKNRERRRVERREGDARRRAERTEEQKERQRAYKREWRLRRNYGLSQAEYDAMLLAQGSCCAICNTDDPGRGGHGKDYFVTDHDHETGKVRGLLCHPCNLALGAVKDNPTRLRAMATYVEAHR